MNKRLLQIFVVTLLVSVILVVFRDLHFATTDLPLISWIGFVLLGSGTAFCTIKYGPGHKETKILQVILLGILIPDLVFRLPCFLSSLISFPTLIVWCFGILVGFIYAKIKKTIIRICLLIVSFAIVSWGTSPGYRLFVTKLNEGAFSSPDKEFIITPVSFRDQNNDNVYLSALKGKYVILYFWNTSNNISEEDFVELCKICKEIESHRNILLYTVDCFDSEKGANYNTGTTSRQEEGCHILSLNSPVSGYTITLLNIKTFPTVLIIDPESNIIYRGNIKSAGEFLPDIAKQ